MNMNEEPKGKPKYTYEELSKKYLEKTPEKPKDGLKQYANDYQMITSFIISVIIFSFLGVFLGNLLDKALKTTPLFILLFSFVGIAACFRNLIKDATRKK